MNKLKPSKYNSVIPIKGCHSIAYNALRDRMLVFKNRIIDLSQSGMVKIQDSEPVLFNKLVDAGFFVDEDIDEFGILKDLVHQTDDNSESFILHVNPTLDCNFHCWYCYENHVPGSIMGSNTLEALKKFINNILLRKTELKSFHIGFFGGEPLIGFDKCARPLIEYVKQACEEKGISFSSNFTSNAFIVTEEIAEFLRDKNCGFQITLDGGPAEHDKTRFAKGGAGSFNRIIKNIILLAEKKISVIVRVNYTSKNIDSVPEIFNWFSNCNQSVRNCLRFDFQRVWQDRNDSFDDTETKIDGVRKCFRDAGYIVLNNYIPHNVSESCYGDKVNHVLINYNGDAYGCTARDFTCANRLGYLREDGDIVYNEDKKRHRDMSKLSKPICRECRIAPLCGGGCKQRASESPDPYKCTFDYSEKEKDNIVLSIIDDCVQAYERNQSHILCKEYSM